MSISSGAAPGSQKSGPDGGGKPPKSPGRPRLATFDETHGAVDPVDTYAVARLLNGHPLNGIADRVSDPFLALVRDLDAAAVGDRDQILDRSIRGILPDAEVDGFIAAVAAVDPDAPAPRDEPWGPPMVGEQVAAVPFPVDVLPPGLADLVREASRAIQAPADYFAAPALGIAGGAIGLSVALRVNSTWTEGPDLSLNAIGGPGTRKSVGLRLMARPAYAIDKELREKYIRERDEYKKLKREWDAKARATGKDMVADLGAEPDPPAHGHLTLDDTTREAVTHVHSQNPRGIISIQDELAAWVASMNLYRSGKGDDKQFWMKVRSGSLVKVTRKGNPEPLIIVRPMVPVVGCMTPSSLPAMGEGPDDGWLDRICFAYPDDSEFPDRGYTEDQVGDGVIDAWEAAVRRLWGRSMPVDDAGQARPFYVHLTDGARARWKQWVDAHYAEQREPEFDKFLAGPWSKLEGFTLRFALILSQLHWAYDPTARQDRPPDVDRQDVEGAARLAAYFKVHFRRVKAELSGDAGGLPEDARAILEWAERNGKRRFTENEVNMALGRFRRKPEDRAVAVRQLVDHSCIRRRPDPPRAKGKRGRGPSPSYDVNPALTAGWRAVNTPPGAVNSPPEAPKSPETGPNGDSLNLLNILNAPIASGAAEGED